MAGPPLDPETLARVTKAVVDIYGDAVARMLGLVTARMARGIDEPGWAEAKLLDLVGLRSDAQTVIDELAKTGPPAVRKAIEEASAAGRAGAARQLGISLVPATNSSAVEALAWETVQSVTTAHLGILRSVDDIYRQVVAEVAAPGVVTGTETTRQAAQRALDRWADVGISGFVDSAGRNWEIQSYAEMATRTASGRAMIDGRLDVYQSDGRDLVIVSDHTQECSLCRPFEGKILSITGGTPDGVVLEDGARVSGTLGEARRAGLLHPSCRHDIRPYIVGLTEPFSATEDPEGDRLRQEQRRLERGVRQWKRRAAVALDENAKRRARAKVEQWNGRLTRHIDDNDLKRLRYREGVRMPASTRK